MYIVNSVISVSHIILVDPHEPLARYVKLRVAHAPGMPGTFSPPPRVSDPDMYHGTCATHVPWCMPGSLNSGFLWSRWRVKRSRHSRRMHNPQFYVSGSNVDTQLPSTQLCAPPTKMADGPDGKIKQCRFLRVYRLLSYSKDMPLVGWLFEPLY